jgi:hypothetical protein
MFFSMVVVSTENNPHIDDSDYDSDVELCDEEVLVKCKKITKRKDSGSSQDREVW